MDLADRIVAVQRQLLLTNREVRVQPRETVRLGRGAHLPAGAWNEMTPEDRHLAKVLAAAERASTPPIFSHASAAVILGLPLVSSLDPPVHVTTDVDGSRRSTPGMVRHLRTFAEDEVIEAEGFRCTSPDRTLIDLARFDTAETAISGVDALLRREFRVGRSIDEQRLHHWRERMQDRLAEMRGRRGVRRAREILGLADARTDSVLESVSHLRLRRLGFEVELQAPVPAPAGGFYYVDFEFLGLDLFGECDGRVKYADPGMRAGEDVVDYVYREKRRQEWVEGSTRKRLIRWGWAEARIPTAFMSMLAAFGVALPMCR